jgi:hypothetical protein
VLLAYIPIQYQYILSKNGGSMMRKAKIILMVMLMLLWGEAGIAIADTQLNSKEQEAAAKVMETIKNQITELKTMGATDAALRLEERYNELKKVAFWKEATGIYDSTIMGVGRLLSGETDIAYCLKGAGETIYLTDRFFQYPGYMPDDPKLKLQLMEQASLILHENMHLHHGANEKDAYIEQYRWLRTFSVNSDGTVDWATMADGSKVKSSIMDNVIIKLKSYGVSIEELEKEIMAPAIAQNWVGTMLIEQSPFYDKMLKDMPPEVKTMMTKILPTQGKSYPMKVMVERRGTNYAKGTITGMTGQSALIDIELFADGEFAQKLRVRHTVLAPIQGGEMQEMEYLWTGRTVGDEAAGQWKAKFVKGRIANEPIYSGSWQMKRLIK